MPVHSAVESMLRGYQLRTQQDHTNALKEIIQQIALLGLFRAGFFNDAAFYGGSALRIFHGLPRFSEDLDFSLIKKDKGFSLAPYCESVETELRAYGFETEVSRKEKSAETAIESAFIKAGTLIHLLKIGAMRPAVAGVHAGELLKIKLEIDTDPPPGAHIEVKYLLQPIPFSVRLYTLPSLFAGKVHALLCRNWKTGRVKGRDLYDFVWYLSRKIPLDAAHLEQRMRQSGHGTFRAPLTREGVLALLTQRFSAIRYDQARQDILPFIRDPQEVGLWSADFFNNISQGLLIEKQDKP